MTGILSIDPATKTGWAFARPGERPVWGSHRMGEARAELGQAVSAMHHFLREKIGSLDPSEIAYERPYVPVPRVRVVRAGFELPGAGGPPPMNAETVFRLAAFAGVIEAAAFDAGLPCRAVTPAQIAKFFTGSARWGSRAEKKAATMRMCEVYGFDVGKSDDAADALALLLYTESLVSPRAAAKRGAGPLFAPRKKSVTEALDA